MNASMETRNLVVRVSPHTLRRWKIVGARHDLTYEHMVVIALSYLERLTDEQVKSIMGVPENVEKIVEEFIEELRQAHSSTA